MFSANRYRWILRVQRQSHPRLFRRGKRFLQEMLQVSPHIGLTDRCVLPFVFTTTILNSKFII